jgi:hypothetical protein
MASGRVQKFNIACGVVREVEHRMLAHLSGHEQRWLRGDLANVLRRWSQRSSPRLAHTPAGTVHHLDPAKAVSATGTDMPRRSRARTTSRA